MDQNTDKPDAKPVEATAVQTSCQGEEFRQLDFWVGEWSLEWDLPDGKTGSGTNIITKTPFGDCVITENFDGAPTQNFKGMSVSTYHQPAGMWRQTWVDDQGGYFALYGGVQDDGTFKLDMTRLGDKGPFRRMIWKDITADSLTWHWQGHGADEAEWKDLWVIRYTRKK
ncbi:MAG: hypothetical protein HKO02_01450 [Hyphomonadaceae bacterium]|nr:hypothetical protein [Hyphomonadaceae bacterium]